MLFRPVDKLPNGYKRTKLKEELDSFIATGYKYAEVDTSEYQNYSSARSSIQGAIKRHHLTKSIKVTESTGKVYLINLLIEGESDGK